MLQQKLQYLLSENVLSNVLVAFQQSKTEKIKLGISQESPNNKIIKNAIQLLISKK